jgi:flavin reductase (DIM6/NTAB) family NADH-FMN oxidoreductase RutF
MEACFENFPNPDTAAITNKAPHDCMIKVDPKEVKTQKFHSYMVSAIAPRPIAFVSTIDKKGNPNLAPFSFFNAFGSHPPLVVFSPARSVRDNVVKHTLENIYEIKEAVINVVNHAMVHQTSLSSVEYPKEVNEFLKAGFTPVPSELVKPLRVKESPVQMECKVLRVLETGTEGGAANLVVCEIVLMHINEDVLTPEGFIDQHKIDLVGRMGGSYYCRASGQSLFEVPKPSKLGIGVDHIPERIRFSKILSGNNLGQLGNVESLPSNDEIEEYKTTEPLKSILEAFDKSDESEKLIHIHAKKLLEENNVADAWKTLLAG